MSISPFSSLVLLVSLILLTHCGGERVATTARVTVPIDPHLTGAAGETGSTGATGEAGSLGEKGAAGGTGTTGTSGVAGHTGTAGTTGVAGHSGATGTAGTTGSTGESGSSGSTGTTGSTGTPGHTSTLTLNINRICSNGRSNATRPRLLFWEDITSHRIISIEVGYRSNNATTILASIPSDNVNLDNLSERVRTISYDPQILSNLGPSNQIPYSVRIYACSDDNGNGKCSDEATSNQVGSIGTILIGTPPRVPNVFVLNVFHGRFRVMEGADRDDREGRADTAPGLCEDQWSPIILDLAGNGLKISDPEDGVSFDLMASGKKIQTAWPLGTDDAFLVRDLDRNERIEDGRELFGNATLLKTGGTAANGFEALKELDLDRNNILDKTDPVFKELRLWIDSNRDGYTDSGELRSLESEQILSLNLNYIQSGEVDRHGNQFRQKSTFKKIIDGVIRAFSMIDVWFRTFVAYD